MSSRDEKVAFLKKYYKQFGWYEDRWGHMQKKTVTDRMQRMKFQARTIRVEIKTSAGWVLQKSFSIKELYAHKFTKQMEMNGNG